MSSKSQAQIPQWSVLTLEQIQAQSVQLRKEKEQLQQHLQAQQKEQERLENLRSMLEMQREIRLMQEQSQEYEAKLAQLTADLGNLR